MIPNALSVPAVYPWDHRPEWELPLGAAAWQHQTVSYHILLVQEKIKIQNPKCGSTECALLLHHHRLSA